MKLVYVSLVILMCVVIDVRSEMTRSGMCNGCPLEEFIRIKRAKYNYNQPRWHNRPLRTSPVRSAPSGYNKNDGRQPQKLRTKVSSRPTNEGFLDEDMHNIMRFMSQRDLDKIIEFGDEREMESPKFSIEPLYERPNYIDDREESYGSNAVYSDNDSGLNYDYKIFRREPFITTYENSEPYNIEYNNQNIDGLTESNLFQFAKLEPTVLYTNKNKMALNSQLEANSVQNQQFFNHESYAHQEATENRYGANIFHDSTFMQEEQLPKPSNLRKDDYEVSYTNNVPTVVKPDTNSYKFENLGALPLMNYHSKLDTVDSYKVPHYTVTSPEGYRPPPLKVKIPVEPAPPASTALEQSDAHLKATKIWTHKSKGTAYTLHKDGTLSLEIPSRPKTNYG